MLRLSMEEIIHKIDRGITFEGQPLDDSFHIKVEDYVPFICTAIHHGHQLRDELKPLIALTEQERWYEEDPLTGEFISSMPITLIGLDSRYEYDLNRSLNECVYKTAWGKEVWKQDLEETQVYASQLKHMNFYKVLEVLIRKLNRQFGKVLIYDIHSYNYKRIERNTPVFNLGLESIDLNVFKKFTDHWFNELKKIVLPNLDTTVAINDVFMGRGYLAQWICKRFDSALVIPTEIKKVYCDEETGETYPLVVSALQQSLKLAVLNNAFHFCKNIARLKINKKQQLLSSDLDNNIKKVDQQLYHILKSFEILNFINPINYDNEFKRFVKNRYDTNPQFHYRQLSIDPFSFKRKLYALPVEKIRDVNIQNLYKAVINAYVDKIEMIASIGTDRFLYNSLRYFGEPHEIDIKNAEFILYAPESGLSEEDRDLRAAEASMDLFKESIRSYGFTCKIELSNRIIAKAMVDNVKKVLYLKKGAFFTLRQIKALIHHEIGVHMVTTMNSLLQPINIFRLGLPLNTLTQEGLAIYSEYCSGTLTIARLKELAIRVVAVSMLTKGMEFKETFARLMDDYKMEVDPAFNLTTRIYRGGGFTKDYVYFKGFKSILRYHQEGNYLDNLLIGKTSLSYVNVINEMIDRKFLIAPKYKTSAFVNKESSNAALDYFINGIR